MKKFFALLLTVCVLVGCLVYAFADTDCVHMENQNDRERPFAVLDGPVKNGEGFSQKSPLSLNTTGTIPEYVENPQYTYDSAGRIKTYLDDDGILWEYEYTEAGNFKYRTTVIAEPEWEFGEPIKYHTETCAAYPAVFKTPFEHCLSFDVTYEITYAGYHAPQGATGVFVNNPLISARRYQLEGIFWCRQNQNTTYTVKFLEPMHVNALYVRPLSPEINVYTGSLKISNLKLVDYNYVTGSEG